MMPGRKRYRIGLAAVPALMLATAAPAAAQSTLDIAYGPAARHRLDVFRPVARDGRPRKVILFFHGGSWRRGSKDRTRFVPRTLARRGYVAVSANYRLFPRVRFPAFMTDAARAVAWVRANIRRFGGDPDRIYLMGHSAGAHIAVLLALDPRYLRAAGVPRAAIRGAIGLAGPYAFRPRRVRWLSGIFARHPRPNARPIAYATNIGPRLLLLHGAHDRLIRQSDPEAMAAAYRRAGGRVRLRVYPDLNHISVLMSLAPHLGGDGPVEADILDFVGRP